MYSKTKLFIGETWKSAQDVIQSDDKEGGVVLVKGLSIQNLFYQMNDHRWTYSYTIKFMIKDNKCRVIIDDVKCIGAKVGTYEWAHMPVADAYPATKGMKLTGVNEKRYLTLMSNLKAELQAVVDTYLDAMSKPLATEDSDW